MTSGREQLGDTSSLKPASAKRKAARNPAPAAPLKVIDTTKWQESGSRFKTNASNRCSISAYFPDDQDYGGHLDFLSLGGVDRKSVV